MLSLCCKGLRKICLSMASSNVGCRLIRVATWYNECSYQPLGALKLPHSSRRTGRVVYPFSGPPTYPAPRIHINIDGVDSRYIVKLDQ